MYRKALKYIKMKILMTVTFKLFTGILVEPGDNDRVYCHRRAMRGMESQTYK